MFSNLSEGKKEDKSKMKKQKPANQQQNIEMQNVCILIWKKRAKKLYNKIMYEQKT